MAAVEALLAGGGEAADGQAADAATHGQVAAPAGRREGGRGAVKRCAWPSTCWGPEKYCDTVTLLD